MKKQLALFVSLLCCFSCVSQKREIIAKSTIKLEGKHTNIRNLIEIDGYYDAPDYRSCTPFMFFEDGTYVDFCFSVGVSADEIKANMFKSVDSGIEDKQFSWGFFWGVYKIVEDTLVVYTYLRGSFWTPWYFNEIRYKIIDRTTMLPIYSKGLRKADEQYCRNDNISPWIKNRKEISFFPADSLPSSDCWLKKEKWIWRNESDWKEYMERIKQIKKQYKKK
jgi:hypothetical protein